MKMGFSSFKFILDICIILLVLVVSEQTIFECHGDVCNVGKVPQFCSSAYKLCRDCHEIKGDCGTAAQPLNCTGYCQEMAVADALKQIRERDEGTCLIVPVVLNIANGYVSFPQQNDSRIHAGSELVYSCHNGYTLEGPDTLVCNGNGTWTPSIMPYCFDRTFIGFMQSTIVLAVICFLSVAVIIFLCCNMKRIKQNISRTSTDSSLNKEEEDPLIEVKSERVHHENETPSDPVGTCRWEHSADEETRPVTSPTPPSAPPAEPNKKEKDEQEPLNKSPCSTPDTRGQEIVVQIFNQTIIDNSHMPQDIHGKDKARDDDLPCDPTRENKKNIDEKMPTEESDEVNAVEETNNEKKGRGTKPLPARDADSQTRAESTQEKNEAKEATYKGPQPVPAVKEENIQTPTKESAEGNTLDMVGIQDITFPKNDIRGNETKLTEKSEDHNFTQELSDLKDA